MFRKLYRMRPTEAEFETNGVRYGLTLIPKSTGIACQVRLLDLNSLTRQNHLETKNLQVKGFDWNVVLCRVVRSDLSGDVVHVMVRNRNHQALRADIQVGIVHPLDYKQSPVTRDTLTVGAHSLETYKFDYAQATRFSAMNSKDGSVTFEIKIKTVVDARQTSRSLGPASELISFEAITDEIIGIHTTNNYGLMDPVSQRSGMLQYNHLVHDFCAESRTRLWLGVRLSFGLVRLYECLDLETRKATTIGEVCSRYPDVNGSIVIYGEGKISDHLPMISRETILVFCKLFDPAKQTFSFKGHFLIEPSARCSLLSEKAAQCAEIPASSDFCLKQEIEGTLDLEIDDASSLAQNEIRSGSIVIVYPKVRQEDEFSVGSEVDLHRRLPRSVSQMSGDTVGIGSQSDNIQSAARECIVCMERPATSGFLHRRTSHRCVCENCADRIMNMENPTCPTCGQSIDNVVLQFY